MTPEDGRTDAAESARMGEVDVSPGVHQATEPDEELVLTELYGAPGADGIFRGEGAG